MGLIEYTCKNCGKSTKWRDTRDPESLICPKCQEPYIQRQWEIDSQGRYYRMIGNTREYRTELIKSNNERVYLN